MSTETIEIKLQNEKLKYYRELLNSFETVEPVSQEKKNEALSVLRSLLDETEESVPYVAKLVLMSNMATALQSHHITFVS